MKFKEVSIDTTKTALERLGMALAFSGASVRKVFSLKSPKDWGRGVSAELLVCFADEEAIGVFETHMGRSLIEMREPTKVKPA